MVVLLLFNHSLWFYLYFMILIIKSMFLYCCSTLIMQRSYFLLILILKISGNSHQCIYTSKIFWEIFCSTSSFSNMQYILTYFTHNCRNKLLYFSKKFSIFFIVESRLICRVRVVISNFDIFWDDTWYCFWIYFLIFWLKVTKSFFTVHFNFSCPSVSKHFY